MSDPMNEAMPASHDSTPHPPATPGWSKHRVEALTDGIFAVAMTLLVIDLKLPDHAAIHTQAELLQALANLLPKAISWLMSFFVLAIFWISHHRMFHYVRAVDQGLLWRNIVQLSLVSLMPFSSSIMGEYGTFAFASQALYNGNMMGLALVSLWKARYIRLHPELCSAPMTEGAYRAARLRIGGLILIGIVALALAWWTNIITTFAYMLMLPIGRYSRRIERQYAVAEPDHAHSDATAEPRTS